MKIMAKSYDYETAKKLAVELKDKNDPTPYWLIATKKPKKLAAALD